MGWLEMLGQGLKFLNLIGGPLIARIGAKDDAIRDFFGRSSLAISDAGMGDLSAAASAADADLDAEYKRREEIKP